MKTKQELLNEINEGVKRWGRERYGEELYYHFCDLGHYMEDKRRSKVQFAIDCLENCFTRDISEDQSTWDRHNFLRDLDDFESNRSYVKAVAAATEYCQTH